MIKGVPITDNFKSLQEYSNLLKMSEFLSYWLVKSFLGILIFYVCGEYIYKIRRVFLHK